MTWTMVTVCAMSHPECTFMRLWTLLMCRGWSGRLIGRWLWNAFGLVIVIVLNPVCLFANLITMGWSAWSSLLNNFQSAAYTLTFISPLILWSFVRMLIAVSFLYTWRCVWLLSYKIIGIMNCLFRFMESCLTNIECLFCCFC